MVLYSTEGKKGKPLARTPDSQSYLMGWSPDGESVYAYESESVTTQIWELPASGGDGRKVTSAELRRKAFDVGASGLIAYARAQAPSPAHQNMCILPINILC